MYAIEFETDLNNRFIEIKEYEKIANKHVKVIILVDEPLEQQPQKTADTQETKALSDHSATLIDDWKDNGEDEVWK